MNVTEQAAALGEKCEALRDAAERAVLWVGDVEGRTPAIKQNAHSLTRILRRIENASRRLGRAAGRRMALGVFGPSQAGKSYLVNSLCQKDSGSFLVRIGDQDFDFLGQINPQNEGESTGLVTRFSTETDPAPDAAFPIHLRLLTELDLVKILVNSCQEDILHEDEERDAFRLPNVGEVTEALDAIQEMAQSRSVAKHISAAEVHDLAEYVNSRYQKPYREISTAGYWDRAADLAPRLDFKGRVRLFSLLWGGNTDFTALFETLSQASAKLENSEDIFCGLDAFIEQSNGAWGRRADSILNVQTLAGIGGDGGSPMTVRTESGSEVTLSRSLISALTAELVLKIGNDAYPFFRHADLLDFPGARARLRARSFQEGAKSKGSGDDTGNPGANFLLRGKVETLFQRYEAEREMTGMLLCIPNGNMEVPVLGDMVHSWVQKTLGPTPETRAKTPNTLFFIMTKFDREFEETTGQDATSQQKRWDTRIQEGLLSLWDRHGWTQDWDGKPFDNSLFLRNPSFLSSPLTIRDKDKREASLNPGMQDFIDSMRRYCSESGLIRKHVADPKAAFDAALALNDGGVSYLVERITALCHPELKLRQIEARLDDERKTFKGALAQFFDGDGHDKTDERTKAAEVISRALMPCAQVSDFCLLLDELTISLDEIRAIHGTIAALADDSGSTGDDGVDGVPAAAADAFDPFGDPVEQAVVVKEAAPPKPASLDRVGRFVQAVTEAWAEKISEAAEDDRLKTRFKIPTEEFRGLVQELIRGLEPVGVAARMADAIRRDTSHANAQWEVIAPRACLIAHRHAANYLMWLGHDLLPVSERADVPLRNPQRKAFQPPKVPEGLPDLPEMVVAHGQIDPFVLDWVHVLRYIAAAHSGISGGYLLSRGDNEALGGILQSAGALS